MGRLGLTYEKFEHCVNQMEKAGESITLRAVREKIGNGSMNTIHGYMQTWRHQRPAHGADVIEVPNAIVLAIANELSQVAKHARSDAEKTTQVAFAEAAELSASGHLLELERDELNDRIASLTTERDQMAGVVAERNCELGRRANTLATERENAELIRIELTQVKLRLDLREDYFRDATLQLEKLSLELDVERRARMASEQKVAVLVSRLDSTENQLLHATKSLDIARDEVNRKSEEAAELRGKYNA